MRPSRSIVMRPPGLVLLVGLALVSACDKTEAGVLVNVQLETADLQVSEVRLRGFAPTQESLVLEVTRARPDNGLFGQTENIYVEVPRSWIGKIVWLQAEGRHEGVVTAHGSVSVLPRKNTVMESTLVLVGAAESGQCCDVRRINFNGIQVTCFCIPVVADGYVQVTKSRMHNVKIRVQCQRRGAGRLGQRNVVSFAGLRERSYINSALACVSSGELRVNVQGRVKPTYCRCDRIDSKRFS